MNEQEGKTVREKIKNQVVVYTDGSIRTNSKGVRKGGYGIVILHKGDVRYFKSPTLGLSNTYIELVAIISTLKALIADNMQHLSIVINTDFIQIKDGVHGRINYMEKNRKDDYKMRYFWLEFQKLYEQFDDLSIRWISRNDGDALNQIADRLAMEGSEIYQVNEKGDYTVGEFLSNTFPYDCILVDGARYYADYETVRDALLDSMVTLDSPAIVTINKPGAQGFAEYFAQEYNLPLIRVIAPECVNSNAMEYLRILSNSDNIKMSLYFGEGELLSQVHFGEGELLNQGESSCSIKGVLYQKKTNSRRKKA